MLFESAVIFMSFSMHIYLFLSHKKSINNDENLFAWVKQKKMKILSGCIKYSVAWMLPENIKTLSIETHRETDFFLFAINIFESIVHIK